MASAAVNNPIIIKQIGEAIGVQSVVVIIDLKKRSKLLGGGYDIYTHNGTQKSKWNLFDLITELEEIGIGEIVINSIDQDGVMQGYDLSLIEIVREKCSMPITVLGGAGSLIDIKELISKFKIIGAAAGSLFVFKGKYKAVLISYPNREERKPLYK